MTYVSPSHRSLVGLGYWPLQLLCANVAAAQRATAEPQSIGVVKKYRRRRSLPTYLHHGCGNPGKRRPRCAWQVPHVCGLVPGFSSRAAHT